MIKVKLSDIFNSTSALQALSQEKLPSKISYQLSKTIKDCQKELEFFEEERKKKVKEMGTEVTLENGQKDFAVSAEDQPKFFKEFSEFAEQTEVELYGEKINVSVLDKIDFPSGLFAQLHWLINE